jgi:hypothetical protein
VPARPVAIRGADEACVGGDSYGGRMSYARRRFLVVVLLILSGMVGGCALRRPAPIDRSILTDDPCAAPCWQGIVPGETTSAEAWDILTTLEFIDHDSYPYRGRAEAAGVEWINWRTLACDDPTKLGNLYAQDGVVSQVEVGLDFVLPSQGVLDKYGAPEGYLAYRRSGHEMVKTEVHLYYPERGLIFVSWAEPDVRFALEADTPISVVYYFEPMSIDELFEAGTPDLRRTRFGKEHLQDWKGLGQIKVWP